MKDERPARSTSRPAGRPAWNTESVAPATRTVVHLLRHGEVHNPEKVLYGRLPGYRLSAAGQQMAKGVAAHLAGSDISYLAASSLTRAQETATPAAQVLGLPITTDDRLIEAANAFEGLRVGVGDGALRQPQHWPKLRNPLTPSWGEPYLQIAHRMLGAIYAAVQAATGHQALLVSHQLPIWTIRRYLEGHRLWHNPTRRQCGLASLTSLRFEDGVFVGLSYAEPVAHLAGAAADRDEGPQVGA
jgi:broad specificity phosphatase PhoE